MKLVIDAVNNGSIPSALLCANQTYSGHKNDEAKQLATAASYNFVDGYSLPTLYKCMIRNKLKFDSLRAKPKDSTPSKERREGGWQGFYKRWFGSRC